MSKRDVIVDEMRELADGLPDQKVELVRRLYEWARRIELLRMKDDDADA